MIWEGLHDRILVILMISATISIILGTVENLSSGWIEGVTILAAVVVVVCVAAINDHSVQLRLQKHNERKNEKLIKVIRDGELEQISIYDVRVGDIVALDAGDTICADGILLSGHGLVVDEAVMTGECQPSKKGPEDPFLLSSTCIVGGIGKMMVICIGCNSQAGKVLSFLHHPVDDTPLQDKLEIFGHDVAKFGFAVASLVLVSLFIKLGFLVYLGYLPLDITLLLNHAIKYVLLSVTILVVAVPEGLLPLSVTTSLAYSMVKMLKEKNLLRRLEDCETMGCCTTICTGNGTLTMNKMTVMKLWVAGANFQSVPEVRLTQCVQDLLVTSIACNSTACEIKGAASGEQIFSGSPIEAALLRFCRSMNVPFEPIQERNPRISIVPFSSPHKCMSSAVQRNGKLCRLTKGNSDVIIGLCTNVLQEDGSKIPLTEEFKDQVKQACTALGLLTHMTLIAVAGIKDPVRPEVSDAVKSCQEAGIVVRLATGADPETAKSLARECGILQEGGIVVKGNDYRAMSEEQRIAVTPNICVMASSSAEDKYILVRTLKDLGHVVAATGEGTCDVPATKEADIGISMQTLSTEVVKRASGITLLDDEFPSILRAVLWGRSVYGNARKFLQFHLTVNFVAVTLAFVGALSSSRGQSPLKAVHILWVNLIMTTMASLALSTEAPDRALLKWRPYKRDDSLITHMMWWNIGTQVLFQIIAGLIVLFCGHTIFGVEKESIEHFTIVFNVIVLFQLFNEINSSKLHGEINVFTAFSTNPIFVRVIFSTLLVQIFLVQFGGIFAGTQPLSL
ncbi:calcium-translocating P-type ATPase, partial [Pelomyxa schiedti]